MFYGLASGKVKLDGITIEHFLEDIQSLNQRAMNSEIEVTAISAHAFPYVADKYWIMETGASMGEGYGPVLVSQEYSSLDELKENIRSGKETRAAATPGKLTTATLLFKIFCEGISNIDVPFDTIMQKVLDGTYCAGLLIHEGQLTYHDEGFRKLLDFGEFWEERTTKDFGRLPLPLGLDVVRKDLGEELARKLSRGLKESIHYGYTHQSEAIPYAMQWGRGINDELGETFVKMYVSELTINMGEKGKQALELLYRLAREKQLLIDIPRIILM